MPRCLSKFPSGACPRRITPSQASSTWRPALGDVAQVSDSGRHHVQGTLPPSRSVLEVGQCTPCGAVHDRDHVEPGRFAAPAAAREVAGPAITLLCLRGVVLSLLGAPESRGGPGTHFDETSRQSPTSRWMTSTLATPCSDGSGHYAVPTLAQSAWPQRPPRARPGAASCLQNQIGPCRRRGVRQAMDHLRLRADPL